MKKATAVIAILIGLVFGFGMAEMVVRIVMPNLPNTAWEADMFCRNRVLNYRFMKPNTQGYMMMREAPAVSLSSNSKGYRDTEWTSKKKKRVLLLGDSFGWGWGCDKDSMIASILEASRDDISVFNLCIPGDDLFRIYSRYRFHVDEIKPDHIIILNYINDFYNNHHQQRQLDSALKTGLFAPGRAASVSCDQYYTTGMKSLLNKSYVFRLANTFRLSTDIFSKDRTDQAAMDSLTRIGYKEEIRIQKAPLWFDSIGKFYARLLSDMALKSKITVLYIPPIYQVDVDKRAEIDRLFHTPDIDPGIVNKNLRNIVSEIPGIDFIDPTDTIIAENRKSPLYFRFDSHLNARGQVFLGQLLADKVGL